MAAATKLFETTELVDTILASIESPRNIFVVQRVGRKWRDIIENAPVVQKILYGPSNKETPVSPSALSDGADHSAVIYDQALNFNTIWQKPETPFFDQTTQGTNKIKVSHAFWFDWDVPNFAKDGSYRKLFLTQPPSTTAGVCIRVPSLSRNTYEVRMTLYDAGGLTLGLLKDAAREARARGGYKAMPNGVYVMVEYAVPATGKEETAEIMFPNVKRKLKFR